MLLHMSSWDGDPFLRMALLKAFFCRDCSIVCKLGESHLTLQSVSAAFWMDGENKNDDLRQDRFLFIDSNR